MMIIISSIANFILQVQFAYRLFTTLVKSPYQTMIATIAMVGVFLIIIYLSCLTSQLQNPQEVMTCLARLNSNYYYQKVRY